MSLHAVAEPFVVAIGRRPLRLRDGVHLTPRFWEPVAVVAATPDARVDKLESHGCSSRCISCPFTRQPAAATGCKRL